jgi:hypothetical protein
VKEPTAGCFHGVCRLEAQKVIMKCSFCESPLQCNTCGKPFRALREETHVGVYQPDMEISCPECQRTLVCKACGFRYGGEEEDIPEE